MRWGKEAYSVYVRASHGTHTARSFDVALAYIHVEKEREKLSFLCSSSSSPENKAGSGKSSRACTRACIRFGAPVTCAETKLAPTRPRANELIVRYRVVEMTGA